MTEELSAASGRLESLQQQQQRVIADRTRQAERLELRIRQREEEEDLLRWLEADAARRAYYISLQAGGRGLLKELAKRGLEVGFAGGEMFGELETYLPAWRHWR